MEELTSNKLASIVARILDDKLGKDITILNISNVSVLADYFVIVGGANKNQVQALVDNTEEELAKLGCHTTHVEGYQSANWILLDYEDVIVHVFNQEDRLLYDLERIWRDGKEVEVEELN